MIMKNINIILSLIFTLYINQNILNSFEKVNNEFSLLVRFGEVKTNYQDKPILIKLE